MAANEAKGWWDSWARYWEPLEDRHFGLAAMERVMRFIASPVLVVGAGHGIIVSALRERGLEVEGLDASEPMIAEAKRRRGLELVHGDARQLPFEAERFRSVIIASGVIDHHADEDDVGQILGEALRVLKPWGNLLVGFYRFDAKLEQVYRHIGVIEGRQYFAKRLFDIGELARGNPFRCVPRIVSWTGRSTLGTLLYWANAGVSMRKHFKREARAVDAVYRLAAVDGVSRAALARDVPERLPYRDEDEVQRLLEAQGLAWADLTPMPDCIVARHQKSGTTRKAKGAPPASDAAPTDASAEAGHDDRAAARPSSPGTARGHRTWHIRTSQMRKRYRGATRDAVRGIDLSVDRGQVFGILGPNGAGKTTTLLMLCGLLAPDSGEIRFSGGRTPEQVRKHIGLVPQSIAVYPQLSARENLQYFGSLHGLHGRELKRRCTELLEQIGLSERADDRVDTYSGGMKRRLNLVTGLIHDPEILLLDEPTVGMDPQSRNRVFDMVAALRRRKVTVLYTTHYMEEASRLCDEVAIMDHGTVLVEGTPANLVAQYGACRVEFEIDGFPPAFADALRALPTVGDATAQAGILTVQTRDAREALALVEQAPALGEAHGVSITLRSVSDASLENVFLHLTGRSMRDEEE